MSIVPRVNDPLIIQSVIKTDKLLIPGLHHYDHLMIDILQILDSVNKWNCKDRFENGYIDQYGNYYTNQEAIQLAKNNKQISESFNPVDTLSQTLWSSEKEDRIVCAALQFENYVFTAPGHFHSIHYQWYNQIPKENEWSKIPKNQFIEGFIDNKGNFLNRKDAFIIANKSDQLNKRRPKSLPLYELFAEDLY